LIRYTELGFAHPDPSGHRCSRLVLRWSVYYPINVSDQCLRYH
jgi:hypothetical protein